MYRQLTLLSVFGRGTPIEPYFQPFSGAVWVAGLASDIPYPEVNTKFEYKTNVSFSN